MQLPPELRRMIYIELLTLNGPAQYWYVHVHIGSITTRLSHQTLPLYFLPAKKSVMKQDQSSSNKTSSSPSTARTINTLLRVASEITRLLCRLDCVIHNDTASCGMLKVLARCSNLYLLKISVKTKDLAEFDVSWCMGLFSWLHHAYQQLLAPSCWGKIGGMTFKRMVMSDCDVESCHMHTRNPEHDGRQQRGLEIDLKVTT